MLVLSRCVGESVIIGDELVIEVIAVTPMNATLRASRRIFSDRITKEIEIKTLRPGEQTSLDIDTAVVLIDLKEDKARLGISAPRSASVHRLEVWEAIQREKPL